MTDTDPTPSEVVASYFGAFGDRDHERLLALSHPEIELWAQPTAERIGRAAPYRGHAGIREYLAHVDEAWAEFSVHPDSLRVAGGGVIAFGHGHGRPNGPGKEIRVPLIWVFRVRDGLVAFCRVARTAAEAEELAGA